MHLFESKIEIKNTLDSIKRMSDIANGDYVAVVTSVNNDEMFAVLFFRCNRKKYFIFDENDHDEVGAECIFKKLPPPEIK